MPIDTHYGVGVGCMEMQHSKLGEQANPNHRMPARLRTGSRARQRGRGSSLTMPGRGDKFQERNSHVASRPLLIIKRHHDRPEEGSGRLLVFIIFNRKTNRQQIEEDTEGARDARSGFDMLAHLDISDGNLADARA